MASTDINTSQHFALTAAMNVAFGNPQGELRDFLAIPGAARHQPQSYNEESWGRLTNQCRNIQSEITEFKKAIQDNDGDEVRDSLCDIRIFAYGGAHFLGYNIGKTHLYTIGLTMQEAHIMEFLFTLDPEPALDAAFSYLMHAIGTREWNMVESALRLMIYTTDHVSARLGLTAEHINDDMVEVLDAVMTRFVKDADDFEATASHHAAYGVSKFYTVGEYPTMAFKSAEDQEDAPQGKFLKSASYRKPVFKVIPGFPIGAAV
ncbi:MAG: hypothetical protein RSE62_03615 [Citrobacter sp.]